MKKIRIIIFVLFVALSAVHASGADKSLTATPGKDNRKASVQDALPDDPLGRSTPQGTVIGFLKAMGREDFDRAIDYLDTKQPPRRAIQLAKQLQTILDRELSREVTDLGQKPQGGQIDGPRQDTQKIGTITRGRRSLDVSLERVKRGDDPPVWLFSAATLNRVPEIQAQLDVSFADRYLPPSLTENRIFHVPLWRWLLFLLIIPTFFSVSWLVSRLLVPLIRPFVRRMWPDGGETSLELTKKPLQLFIAGLASFAYAPFAQSVLASLFWTRVAQALTVVGLAWLSLRLIDMFLKRSRANQPTESSGKTALGRLLGQLCKVLTVVAGAAVLLYYAGFNLTALLTGLGVSGIAIAFAAQKTLENLFGGIMIVSDKPIRVGDLCRAGEHRGVVEDIGLRSTRIRTNDRTIVSVPNGQLSVMSLENFTMRDKIRFKHVINLTRKTSSDQLREVLSRVQSMLERHQSVEPNSARVRLTAIRDSSFELEIFAYILATSWETFLGIQEEVLLTMIDIIEASGSSLSHT